MILTGDSLKKLKTIPCESVQMAVTSPPYFGLRDYGVPGQIGLEPTPEEFTARLVNVFREVRRVLKNDGVLWLNLGDSYESKSLIGIPWMVAFALRADGWYLRSDCIWHKPNPMPESVTDRPTKAHEYMFLLSKSAAYFYDADAVREPNQINPNSGWAKQIAAGDNPHKYGNSKRAKGSAQDGSAIRGPMGPEYHTSGRNRRTVWTVTTKPYPGSHFATFPPKLIEPCILAGSRPGDVVLDPFAGACTTGLVAQQHGREFIGIELNPAYVAMGRARLAAHAKKRAA